MSRQWDEFTERERLLLCAMHDATRILGFDKDGDITPAAEIAGGGIERYVAGFIRDVSEARQDYNDALDEACYGECER